jgi:enamine deaminase RidA (YjgF/YER057c/UK114 family)
VIKYYNNVPGLVDPLEPYSYVVSAGQTLYLAGQVALDKNGSDLENIVKINYFLRDIRELNDEIEIRKTLFKTNKFPAVTAIQAAALGLPGLLLEVDIVAVSNDA